MGLKPLGATPFRVKRLRLCKHLFCRGVYHQKFSSLIGPALPTVLWIGYLPGMQSKAKDYLIWHMLITMWRRSFFRPMNGIHPPTIHGAFRLIPDVGVGGDL